jgi:DNA repair exonuclease SbcCD ATPase subunit
MINKDYRKFLDQNKVKLDLLQDELSNLKCQIATSILEVSYLNSARDIMISVGIISQQKIKEVIEELVTQALQVIFGDDYSFELTDQVLRNKSEISMSIVEHGHKRSLREAPVGTFVDVVSLMLRIIAWSIQSDRTRNTLILDEPLKSVSKDRLPFLQQTLSKLSEMLGLQIIFVTHEKELARGCDRVFNVSKVNEISHVDVVALND